MVGGYLSPTVLLELEAVINIEFLHGLPLLINLLPARGQTLFIFDDLRLNRLLRLKGHQGRLTQVLLNINFIVRDNSDISIQFN